MAEKTVAIRLIANIGQYQAAMAAAASASGQFSAATQASMRKLGGDMQRVGGTLTRSVSLPLAVAGAGALKLGLDFDTAFSRMVGLAGVAAGEVDGLKESVLDLAGQTGQAPVDLADALYEAASAGLDSAQALDAVEVAAKGAASGMGSAEDIVGLVASATASYGAANITAAEAVDVLTQTIREGRADPEELAGSLGRILPIAAQLGVSFAEVGGIVAYTTNAFGDTDRAITGVNDTLAKLSAPADSSRKVLTEMGTSVEELHAAIREDGLLGGLELLRDHGFAGNAQAIRKLMPDMQGAATLTLLLNDASGTLADTLAATADSAGAAGEAFATSAETDMFKMKQAWAELQVALISASDIIIPIVTGVVGAVGDLAEKFSDLPGPVQAAVIGFLGFVAAIGPLMRLGGTIIRNLGLIVTGLEKVGGAANIAKGGVAALGVVLVSEAIYQANAAREAKIHADNLRDLGRAADAELLRTFVDTLKSGIEPGETFADSMADIAESTPGAIARLVEMEDSTGAVTRGLISMGMSADTAARLIADMEAALDAERAAQEAATATTDAAQRALDDTAGATDDAATATDELADAEAELASQTEQVNAGLDAMATALTEQADAARGSVDAGFALRDSQRDAADAAAKVDEVMGDEESTLQDLAVALDDASKAAFAVADATVRQADEAYKAAGVTLTATTKSDLFNQSLIQQAATLDGPARQALVDHIAQLNDIPPEVASEILALIDQGKVAEAEGLLQYTSRTREPQLIADAITGGAESSLNWTARQRDVYMRAVAVGNFPHLAEGGMAPFGGAVVGENFRPELLNGRVLVSSPTLVPGGTKVTGEDETARLLAAMDPRVFGPLMTALGASAARSATATPTTSEVRDIHVHNHRRDIGVADVSLAIRLARFAA